MKIYNKYMLCYLIGFLNQYTMDLSHDDGSLGLFVLSVSQERNEDCYAKSNYAFPGLLVKRNQSRALSRAEDLAFWESRKKAFAFSKKESVESLENNILIYPLMGQCLQGASGGIAHYISNLKYDMLLDFNSKHTYNIGHAVFATGVLSDSDFKKIDKIGGLYYKLKSVDIFLLNNRKLIKYSTLLLPKNNEQEYNLIKNYATFQNMPEKIYFVSSLSEVDSAIDKIVLSQEYFSIDITKEEKEFSKNVKKDNSEFIKNDIVSLMTIICTKLHKIESSNNDNEMIDNFNLFLTYYQDWYCSEEKPKEDSPVYKTLFPFISYKLGRTALCKDWVDILKNIFLYVRVPNNHKICLIKSLETIINKILLSQNNDFQLLSLLYQMIDELVVQFENINNYKKLCDKLKELIYIIKDSKKLLYINSVKEYQEKVEKIKIDNEELFTINKDFIKEYPLLFSVKSIDIVKEKQNEISCDLDWYFDINHSDVGLKKINTDLKKFLNQLELKYKNNEIIVFLNEEYGINTFEKNIPTKKFFELLGKTDIYKKESVFLMFLYFHNTLEKNIFELDNPEFKEAWKNFILKWVVENSSFEPLALLLSYYSFYRYLDTVQEQSSSDKNNISDKKEFYCNLLADVFISNLLNEPLLKYLIDILKNNEELKDFFDVIIKRAHQVNNNYIKQYLFDLLIQKIEENKFELSWYEGIASCFFTFPVETQHWYIENKFAGKKYLIYALIKFIYIKNKNDNNFRSLHRVAIFSNDWLLDQDNLVVYQDTLKKLLSLFINSNIKLNSDDYIEPSDLYRDCWFDDSIVTCLVSPMWEYPEFLIYLLNNAKNYKQDKNRKLIQKRLENMQTHYNKQIEMAKTYNNKYVKYYKDCLSIIQNIENPPSKTEDITFLKNKELKASKKNNEEKVVETKIETTQKTRQEENTQLIANIFAKEEQEQSCLNEKLLKDLFSILQKNKKINQPKYEANRYCRWLLDFYCGNNTTKWRYMSSQLDEQENQVKLLQGILKEYYISEADFLKFLTTEAMSD